MGKKRERTGSKPTRYFDYSLLFIIIFFWSVSDWSCSIRPVLTMGS